MPGSSARSLHLAPLYTGAAPESAIPYRSPAVRLRPVPPAGGEGALAKLGILVRFPAYLRSIMAELQRADVVQVRCPANIGLLALVVLSLVRSPQRRWAKYAGNWAPAGQEAWSYTLQRWWLSRGLHHGTVTVNGRWPGQPPHVYSFFNPCLTDEELAEAAAVAAGKELAVAPRLVFVGRLEKAKGVETALRRSAGSRSRGCRARSTSWETAPNARNWS